MIEKDAVLLVSRDYVYIRTDPDPMGGQAKTREQIKRSDLAITRQHLKIARQNDLLVHRKYAVTERIGAAVAASGRPKFMKLLRRLKPGTGLVVCSLDGLGRDTDDILATIRQIAERGAEVYCLEVSYDEISQSGNMLSMLKAVGNLTQKTQAEYGRAKELGRGVVGGRVGRPPSLDSTAQTEVRAGLSAGETVAALARRYNTSRQTILRIRGAQK